MAVAIGTPHVLGNLVVAVNPGDLFDQVDLARQVAAPGRRHDFDRWRHRRIRSCALVAAERQQNPPHFGRRDLDAQDPPQSAPNRSLIGCRAAGCWPTSMTPSGQFAAGQVPESTRSSGGWPSRLPAGSSPRSKRYDESLCRSSRRAVARIDIGVELGASISTSRRGRADFGLGSAHHAGQCHRPARIGDHAHRRARARRSCG